METAALEVISHDALHYLNRLSDFLFTLARWVNHQSGTGDVEWIPVDRTSA